MKTGGPVFASLALWVVMDANKSEVRSNVEIAFKSAKIDAKNYKDKLEVGELGFVKNHVSDFQSVWLLGF